MKTEDFAIQSAYNLLKQCPDKAMDAIVGLVEKGARSTSVLITGETGVGKEIVAKAIHEVSDRRESEFIVVDCTKTNKDIMEIELFGCEQGAFTGALNQKKGYVEIADGGTIFLDEVGELSPEFQVRLLRILDGCSFNRTGGTVAVSSKFSIVAATSRNLLKMVKEGTFRRDLYYRLNIFPIHVPPLRKRPKDILYLAKFFIEKFSKSDITLTSKTISCLERHPWPGNVREVRNVMERAILVGEGNLLLPEHLPSIITEEEAIHVVDEIRSLGVVLDDLVALSDGYKLREIMDLVEMKLVKRALDQCNSNYSQAAKRLGLTSPQSAMNKANKHGLRKAMMEPTG